MLQISQVPTNTQSLATLRVQGKLQSVQHSCEWAKLSLRIGMKLLALPKAITRADLSSRQLPAFDERVSYSLHPPV